MRIKVDTEYLDFSDSIEIERQAKLFQDVSGVFGDYSYSFSIPKTDRNLEILDLLSINQKLAINVKRDCILFTDSGEEVYTGFIRIESIGEAIECSFFTGNNSWFEATRKRLNDYNFNRMVKAFNYDNVVASWSLKSGIVWPLVDRGTLHRRSVPSIYDNDFHPFIYVKDVINVVLAQSGGIKIEGDILKDPLYNTMMTTNNGLSGIQDRISRQTAYIGKGSNQLVNSTTPATLTFTDTSSPYEESLQYDTSTSTYTLYEGWAVGNIEYNLNINPSGSTWMVLVIIQRNNSTILIKYYKNLRSINDKITLNNLSGGVLKIQVSAKLSSGLTGFTVMSTSFIKISPVKFINVYPQQLLPDLDANEFIANVFTQLNIFSAYDHTRKVIETRLLESIKNQDEIDISEYVSRVTTNDFIELIGDYSKSSRFMYGESGDDYTEEYNSLNPVFYGGGEIVIDNDFLEDNSDFAELDFVAPWQIPVSWLGFTLPLLEMNEFVIEDNRDFEGVANASGVARFRWNKNLGQAFNPPDLVKISGSSVDSYNGIYTVTASALSGNFYYIEVGIPYDESATGKIEKLRIDEVLNEDQITICNIASTDLSDFTELQELKWYRGVFPNESTFTFDNIALGYFWLPQVNKPINRIRQSLSFGAVNDPQYYQQGLIEKYYNISNQVLNNPIMLTAEANIPEKVFRELDFLRPLRLKMEGFNSQFLLNRITGYQGSHLPCEMEIIKITNAEIVTNIAAVAPTPPPPDPEPDLYNYYLCSISECGECFFFRERIVQSLDLLTVGKYYEAEYVTDPSLKVVVLVLSESSGFPVYRVTNSTQNDTCGEIIC